MLPKDLTFAVKRTSTCKGSALGTLRMWLLSLVGIEVIFIGQNVVEASELRHATTISLVHGGYHINICILLYIYYILYIIYYILLLLLLLLLLLYYYYYII